MTPAATDVTSARRHADALFVLGLVTLTFAVSWGGFRAPAVSEDEMLNLVIPLRLLHGSVLYRDVISAYGPGSFDLFAGLFRVLGSSITLERVVGLGYHLSLTLACYRLGARVRRLVGVICAVISAIALAPLSLTAYAWLGAAGFVLWSVSALLRGDKRGFTIAGVLGGLAVCWRPDIAPMVALSWAPLMRRSLWRWTAVGLAVGLLPLIATLFSSPTGVLDDVFLGRLRAAGQSRLPIPPPLGEDRLLLLVVVGSTVVCLATAIARRRDRLIWALTGVALLTVPQALQRADWVHLLCSAAVAGPLAVAVIASGWAVAQRRGFVVGLSVAAITLALFAAPHRVTRPLADFALGHVEPTEAVVHAGRSLPMPRVRARQLAATIKEVELLRNGTRSSLFVGPRDLARPAFNDLSLYYLLPDLAQEARNVVVDPGVTNAAGSGLAADVSRADVVVLVDTGDVASLVPNERRLSQAPLRELSRRFCAVAVDGPYEVLRRCR